MRYVLLSIVVVSMLAAGCVDDPAPSPPDDADGDPVLQPITAPDGRDLRTDLTAEDRLPAPVWQIGERFGYHVFFGSSDTEGAHFDSIVVAEDDEAWLLATDNRDVAKMDAVQDLPILGDIQKDDLSMSAFGDVWDLYDFPLQHGATWAFEFPNVAWDDIPGDTVELTAVATFAAKIAIPEGTFPGYQITARTSDGKTIAEYDYVPQIGWFAHFTLYDIDEGQDPIEFQVNPMGHAFGWTGTYYLTTAEPLVEHLSGVGLDPDDPANPFVAPMPTATFTMSADGDLLFGLVASLAIVGMQEVVLVAPDGATHHWENVGAPEGEVEVILEVPAQAGEWRIVTAGAGAVALAYLALFEMVEISGDL